MLSKEDIKRLHDEIDMQTRNGKKTVYLRMEDLKELFEGFAGEYGDNRMFIEAKYVEEKLKELESKNSFKESLKVKKPIKHLDTTLTDIDETGFKFKHINEREI